MKDLREMKNKKRRRGETEEKEEKEALAAKTSKTCFDCKTLIGRAASRENFYFEKQTWQFISNILCTSKNNK